MEFYTFVFLIVAIIWLLDLVVELLVEIVTKLTRLLQILFVLAIIFLMLYIYITYEGHVPIELDKKKDLVEMILRELEIIG